MSKPWTFLASGDILAGPCNFRGLCEGEDGVLKLALESDSFKVGVKVRVRGLFGMVRVTLRL